jgi:hypothetical protein
MTGEYPVVLDITSPERFARVQLALRLLLAMVLGWIGITAGWLVCALFGVLPLFAAVAISTRSSPRYLEEVAPRLWRVLSWLLQLSAYMALLVDELPTGGDHPVQIRVRFTGTPTVQSALLRMLTSIPSGLVLTLLWVVSGILWVIAAVAVLLGWQIPSSIQAFQTGVLRWQARLVAYHASLVEEYPPFAFDTSDHGSTHGQPLAPAGAP